MRGSRRVVGSAIVAVALLAGGCPARVDGPACEDPTHTILQVASDPTAYDGVEARICGVYFEVDAADPDCEPVGGSHPEVEQGSYVRYPSTWALEDETIDLGTVVMSADGRTQLGTPPPWRHGDFVQVDGTLFYATVPDPCDLDRLYESLYLRIAAADVGVEDAGAPGDPPDDD